MWQHQLMKQGVPAWSARASDLEMARSASDAGEGGHGDLTVGALRRIKLDAVHPKCVHVSIFLVGTDAGPEQ
eukprot:15460059-Alexandrium_andersonii.AAC.1